MRAFPAKELQWKVSEVIKNSASLWVMGPHLRPIWLAIAVAFSKQSEQRLATWLLFYNHVPGGILQWKQASNQIPPDAQIFLTENAKRQLYKVLSPLGQPTNTLSEIDGGSSILTARICYWGPPLNGGTQTKWSSRIRRSFRKCWLLGLLDSHTSCKVGDAIPPSSQSHILNTTHFITKELFEEFLILLNISSNADLGIDI